MEIVQPGEEKALTYLKGGMIKMERDFFTRVCKNYFFLQEHVNRTRGNGLKLKDSRSRLEKTLYCKGGETLEQYPGKLSSMAMFKVRLHGTLSNLA